LNKNEMVVLHMKSKGIEGGGGTLDGDIKKIRLTSIILIFGSMFSIVAIFFVCAKAAIDVPTMHLDGAFQTASALFRLASGELPGRDFFPYLGVGPMALIYPVFALFGKNLAASVEASRFVVALVQSCSVSLVIFLCLPRDTPLRGLTALALGFATIATLFCIDAYLPVWLSERLSPGNSLRPVRSFGPVIAAWVAYFAIEKRDNPTFPYALLGFCAGVATFWSNDFALPTILACIVAAFGVGATSPQRGWQSAVKFTGFAAIGASFLFVSTDGHVKELLHYNFSDVARDQWWYFGYWGDRFRIFSPIDLWKLPAEKEAWAGIVVIIFLAIHTLKQPKTECIVLLGLGATLALGGIVASVGGHLDGYFAPLQFWAVTVTVCFVSSNLIFRRLHCRVHHIATLTIIISCAAAAFSVFDLSSSLKLARDDAQRFYVKELGGYLNRDWEGYVNRARITPPGREIEEYFGIWSAIRHPAPLLPVDALIHALGEVRDDARHVMDSMPDTVITTRADFNTWQSWSLSANYWFYRVLLVHYRVVAMGPRTLIWNRRTITVEWPQVPCSIKENVATLGAVERGYYELTVHYATVGPRRSLAMVQTGLTDAADSKGFASIPPGEGVAILPIFWNEDGQVRVYGELRPTQANGHVKFLACSAKKIDANNAAIFEKLDAPYPFSNGQWLDGISRFEPDILLAKNKFNIDEFRIGRYLLLADGTERKILRIERSTFFVGLHLEGSVLDVKKVGFPNSFILK